VTSEWVTIGDGDSAGTEDAYPPAGDSLWPPV